MTPIAKRATERAPPRTRLAATSCVARDVGSSKRSLILRAYCILSPDGRVSLARRFGRLAESGHTGRMSSPLVFDRALVHRRLARAIGSGYADFLLRRALDEFEDRLGTVLRHFPLALDAGTPTGELARRLAASGRVDQVVRMATTPGQVRPPLAILGDPEALPFGHGLFDLAVSLLAFQSVNDLPGTLIQLRRSLKPDGLFLGCLFGGTTLNELRQSFTQAEAEMEAGVSPRVAPFADVRDLGGLLQRAGFALPVADVEPVVVRYDSAFGLFRDLRAMGLTNPLIDRRKVPLRRATLMRATQVYAERFADADGRVRATFDIVWLSGWAPHRSQQKPLQPGSAKVRLAAALGVEEVGVNSKKDGP